MHPRVTVVPKSKNKCYHAIRDAVGMTSAFGTRKACVLPANVLHTPQWPCPGFAPGGPQAGQKWPKITKNGPQFLRGGPQKVSLPRLMDKINLDAFWVAFGPVWTHVAPKRCPLGPKSVHLGPKCVLRAQTEKWPYLGLDGPTCESVDTFPTCKPPL